MQNNPSIYLEPIAQSKSRNLKDHYNLDACKGQLEMHQKKWTVLTKYLL